MPMVPRCDYHRINVWASEQFAKITVEDAVLVAVMGVGHSFDRFTAGALHVANRDKLHVLLGKHHAQVILPTRSQSDPGEHNPFAGRDGTVPSQRPAGDDEGKGQSAASDHGMFKKIATTEIQGSLKRVHAQSIEKLLYH